ncbi:hypothetical protein Lal_00002230 [Lupinus albus]|nr:hypothetical protein Lal_00002230 [Lupinus albus]
MTTSHLLTGYNKRNLRYRFDVITQKRKGKKYWFYVSDSTPYAKEEKVFAYHSTPLYEAKVKQVEYKHNH